MDWMWLATHGASLLAGAAGVWAVLGKGGSSAAPAGSAPVDPKAAARLQLFTAILGIVSNRVPGLTPAKVTLLANTVEQLFEADHADAVIPVSSVEEMVRRLRMADALRGAADQPTPATPARAT